MSKGKWFLLIVLLLGLVLIITSCDRGGGSNKETYKIAYVGPLTGGSSDAGIGGKNSFTLAINEANKSGQLKFKLEPLILDDAGEPQPGVAAAKQVVSDPKVLAVVAHYNSAVAMATVDTFHRAGLPTIIWGAVNPDITKKFNYNEINRVIPASPIENAYSAKFLIDKLGLKKFAITYDTSSYGLGNADDFEKEVKKNGGEVLFKDGVQVGQRDFTAMLTKIKRLNPEVIYYGGVAAEAALIRKQMDDLKINAVFTGVSGLNSETYQQLAGQCAEGTIINYGGKDVSDLPNGQSFIKKYQEAGFKEPYQAYGPYAYDAANIIVEALKKVGPDKKVLVEEIRKTTYDGVLGKTSFDEFGDTTNTQIITTAVSQDGKWIPWEKSEYANGTKKLPFVKK